MRVVFTHEARQRRQRGLNKVQSHRTYIKNRAKNKVRARKRYRKMRNNSAFKRHQKLYRKNPTRFKRLASMGEFFPLPFWSDAMGSGAVVGADGNDVFYVLTRDPEDVLVLDYQDLLDSITFFEEDDINRFFDLLDAALETPLAARAVSDAIVAAIENDEIRLQSSE